MRTREAIWADLQAAWEERKAVTDRLWDLRREYLAAEEVPGHLPKVAIDSIFHMPPLPRSTP